MQKMHVLIKKIKKYIERFDKKYQKIFYLGLAALLVMILFGIGFGIKKIIDINRKSVYEVAIMARSQVNHDLTEDAKTSLKYGDVVTVIPQGHHWSRLEEVSFIIIKMKLTQGQKAKLTQSKYKKSKYQYLDEENRQQLNERIKEGGLKEIPREIVLARIYRINMEKNFKDFEPTILLHKQPYQYKIFDWSIVKKK